MQEGKEGPPPSSPGEAGSSGGESLRNIPPTERVEDTTRAPTEQLGRGAQRGPENLGTGQIPDELLRQIDEDLARRFPEATPEQRRELADQYMDQTMGYKATSDGSKLEQQMEKIYGALYNATEQGIPSSDVRITKFQRDLAVKRSLGIQDEMSGLYREAYREEAYEQILARRDVKDLDTAKAHERAKKEVTDYIEKVIIAAEEDDANVDQNEQAALRSAINFVFAKDEDYRNKLTNYVHGRSSLHLISFASKYVSAEALSQTITNFNTFHWAPILEILGVKEAIELLEEKDKYGSKGAYYRNPEVKTLDMTNKLVEIIWKQEKEKLERKGKNTNEKGVREKIEETVKQQVWLMNQKYRLIEASKRGELGKKGIDNLSEFKDYEDAIKLVLYKLNPEQTNIGKKKPHTPRTAVLELMEEYPELLPKYIVDKEGDSQDIRDNKKTDRQRFIDLITSVHRAFNLAVRIHNGTGMSSYYDGPRWKEGAKIPREYWNEQDEAEYKKTGKWPVAGKNRLVDLNPTVAWKFKDTADGKEKTVYLNLRTAQSDGKDNPLIRKALDDLREVTKKDFSEIWNREYRKFYREHYEDIDFDGSANSGRSARILRRIVNFPVILSQTGEVWPGKAKFLCRFTHLHTPSLMQMLGYDSALDTVNPDNWGENYALMKEGWAQARLANAEKFKTAIQREEPDILNSTKSLRDFVEALEQKMKPHMKHIMTGTGEVAEAMEDWIRGLLEFRSKYSDQVGLLNLTKEGLELEIDKAQVVGLIKPETNKNLKRAIYTPRWLLKLAGFAPFSPDSFPGSLIWSAVLGWEFFKEEVKKLWWAQGAWEFFKNLFIQFVKPQK